MSEAPASYFERMKLIKLGLLPKEAVAKAKKPLRNKSLKVQAEEAAAKKAASVEGVEESLNQWFQRIEDKHWGVQDLDADGNDHSEEYPLIVTCMECGVPISRVFARHATAHLLPKKIFKSIATNDLNYLILGVACGDHDRTHTLAKFVKMKVWKQAAAQINQLLPLLPYDELKYVSAQLYEALENY